MDNGQGISESLKKRIRKDLNRYIRENLEVPGELVDDPVRSDIFFSDPFYPREMVERFKDRLRRDKALAKLRDLPFTRRMACNKQLPFVHFFCPSAEHTNYVHDDGVAVAMACFCEFREIKPDLAEDSILMARILRGLFRPPFGHGLDPLMMLGDVYGDAGEALPIYLLIDFLGEARIWSELWRSRELPGLKRLRDHICRWLGNKRRKRILRILRRKELTDEELLVSIALTGKVLNVNRIDYIIRDYGLIKNPAEALSIGDKAMDILRRLKGLEKGRDEQKHEIFSARDTDEAEELKDRIEEVLKIRYRLYTSYYYHPISLAGDELISHLVYRLCMAVEEMGSLELKRSLLKIVLLEQDQLYRLLDELGEEDRLVRSLAIKARRDLRWFPCMLEIGIPIKPIKDKLHAKTFMEHVKSRYCRNMENKLKIERHYAERLIKVLFKDSHKGYEKVYQDVFGLNREETCLLYTSPSPRDRG